MKTKQVSKIKKLGYALGLGVTGLLGTGVVSATPLLDNDSLAFLPNTGSDLGTFLKNMVPGVAAVVIVFAVVGGITLLFRGIFEKVRGQM